MDHSMTTIQIKTTNNLLQRAEKMLRDGRDTLTKVGDLLESAGEEGFRRSITLLADKMTDWLLDLDMAKDRR
jgi:hypothetical protein